ncbi:putative mitochondrial carrier C4G8.08 [Yarrowia sp. B02]|nr:putative mitochondrial carrier C4G8.08 [Yarrowia sp. B02]
MDLGTIMASVAGAVGSKIVFHPLDTIRTLQQTSTNFNYILPLHRYWRGLGASVALTTPAFTTYMVSYRQCKRFLTPYLGDDSMANYVISGAVAELASSFIWTPMEVIKGRMQISAKNVSTLQIIKRIYATEGIRGFFRGYVMGIVVFLPHSVVWWVTYEKTKAWMEKRGDLGLKEYAVSSAAATCTASVASNFLDVVKTRQQLAVSDEIKGMRPDDQKSVVQVGKNLIKEVGLGRALFKGLHIRLLHSLPSSVLSMIIVETLNPDTKKSRKHHGEQRQSFEAADV